MSQQKHHVQILSVMAQDAVRTASGWLQQRLPDRFGPADPVLNTQEEHWCVPVVLAYPGITVGQVGEILVDAGSGEIIQYTDPAEMRRTGLKLGRKHRAKVRAAFLLWA
jgi:hypothetical protein